MNRLFIVEGPDCSGKSTFAKHLATQRNATYIHASGAKSLHTAMQDYHKSLLSDAKVNLLNRDVVMDRFWPSELVYGQIFRPHMSDRVYDFVEILPLVATLNPTYIFCDDPEVENRHAKQQDQDHPYNAVQFAMVVDSYRKLTVEMMDMPALPNLWHPRTPPSEMKFDVRRYSLLDHGDKMGTFVDAL